MLDRYKEIREDLLQKIDSVVQFCQERGSFQTSENLKEVRDKLAENRFHLVVLGQFKRGKSTFINSILDDKVLPTSAVPLTSIITLLKYGSNEHIEVVSDNGCTKTITRAELPDYVTEKGNPENEKDVKQVEIAFPSQYLKDGVYLIDTPGVGSTFENNTEMTYNYLFQKILPTKLSKGRVLKDIRKRLPHEIDKNCGRVRWDFMDRVKRSFMNFRWELNQKINATEQSIRRAIEKAVEMKKKSAAELEEFKARVNEQVARLEEIKKELVRLEEAISQL